MRLFGYYLVHTVVNGIKKLFRTWVAILFGICLLFGVLGGIVGVTVGTLVEENTSGYEEELPEEEPEEMSPEDVTFVMSLVEAAAGGIILLILLANIYGGDKSGSHIFTMSDVNFLFAAPMRPQSVLLFRVVLQMGGTLVASLYLAFQIPNLMLNMGLDIWTVLAIFACYILTLIIGKLLSVLTYTLVASHPGLRQYIRPGVFGAGLLLVGATVLVSWLRGLTVWEAALWMFGTEGSRYVPGWGWLKGIVGYTLEGTLWPVLLCALGVIALATVLVYITWRLKADFYEDALDHATQVFNIQASAAEGRSVRRKKDRSTRLHRDGLSRGEGASAFFFKGVYNHHRFAYGKVFTGLGITFFGTYLLWTVLCRFTEIPEEIRLLVPGVVVLCITFFRNMAGPLEQDMSTPYFMTVPESAFRKVLFSMLAGSYEILMNMLPGLVLATLLLRASVAEAVLWLVAVVTLDWFCGATRLLLARLLPASLSLPVKASLLLMFKLLLVMVPLLVLIFASLALGLSAGLAIASAIHVVIGGVCLIPAVALLHEGEG